MENLHTSSEYLELLAAAKRGNARSQNFLGAYLASSSDSDEVQREAFYWYAEAVRNGNTDSKWNAGTMLLFGEGVDRPYVDQGIALIKSAAAAGHSTACSFLANAHRKGSWHLNIDVALAESYESKAADAFNVDEISESIDLRSLGVQLVEFREKGI
jgi:uncharacterized protein